MKKSTFWKLGITATMLFGLSACDDTVSSGDNENNGKNTNLSSSSEYDFGGKSSAKETKSSNSNVPVDCDSVSTSLAAPTNLNIVKNSDSTWILLWDYTASDDRPEEVFIVQSLNMSDDTPKWKNIDSTDTGVTMYNLKGSKKAGKYYRIAAKDRCGISKASGMVQASASGAGSTSVDANLSVPANLALEALGNDQWRLSWTYEENANRPENGFKVQYLNISSDSPKWKDAGTTNKGVRVFKIEGSDKRGYMYHVAAIDANGKSEYSAEITVPKEGLGSTGSETEVTIAVPTDLKFDSIGQNKWRLSWKHEDKKERPENGFNLQVLDLNNLKKWANLDSTKKGVRYYTIDNSNKKFDDSFIRIAARDSLDNNKPATYSEEILIPSYIDYSTVNAQKTHPAPTNLKLDTLGFGQYQLSWDYDDYTDNGFFLQSLDPKTEGAKWTDEQITIEKGVHLVILDGAGDAGGKLFRVAAYIGAEKKETSLYSTAIAIPQVASDGTVNTATVTSPLNAPTNLTVIDMGQNKYKLTWSYTNSAARPENGFKIQKLIGKPLAWSDKDALETSKNVYFYVVQVKENEEETHYRVAAKDDSGESDYTEDVVIPAYMENPPQNGCIGEYAVPTNLKAERVAPSAWRLIWEHARNKDCLEEGFVVQQLDASIAGSKIWEDLDSTDEYTHYYNLEGIENLNKYYRVAAKRGSQRTAFSSDVQITRLVNYSADVPFKAPTAKARVYYYFDETAKSKGTYPHIFYFQAVVEEGFPNHSIVYYKNTANLEYQFRWNGETENEWEKVAITDATGNKQNEYSTTAIRKDIRGDLCYTYAQVRIIWTVEDGVKDTTDWSVPVGPLYNTFEYLPAPAITDDCDKLFPDEKDKLSAEYKECLYYQPLDYRPCQEN